ncbi:MAG: histidine phosphatase family protein [Thermotogota bacterium]
MKTEIHYFVHGTTSDNENNRATGWQHGRLSQSGMMQTIESAKITRNLFFDAIFCSDLFRAKQTANLLFDTKKNKMIYDKRLRECNYGIFNGASKEKVNYLEHIEKKFEKGESLVDVETRIRMFLSDLNHNFKTIALISHRAPQLALEVCINKNKWVDAIKNDWRKNGKWQLFWKYDYHHLP